MSIIARLKPEKIRRYAGGLWAGLRRFRLRYLIKLFSGDAHAIRHTLHGFLVVADLNDWTVGRSILMTGTYERNVTRAIEQFLKPDTQFLDVGANIGWFSLFVASQCPQATVHSFEPDSRVYDLLTVNVAINAYRNRVHIHNMAVGEEHGELIITDLGAQNNYGARFTHNDRRVLEKWIHGDEVTWGTVESVAIDEFLPETDFDLVKIDIEGFEPVAVRGMEQMLARCKPIVACEFAPSNIEAFNDDITPQQFLKAFIERGYTVHIIDPDGALIDCGTDSDRVMAYMDGISGHHLDLIFQPQP